MSATPHIEIAGRRIGADQPPYVICELSGNHNGSLERALSLVDAAAATGCDAIKIQTYTADTITLDVDRPEFRITGGLWDGRTLHELYREAQTPFEWHAALFARAAERGVTLFSSPFDETAVDLLDSLGAPAFKIASFEAVDLPLIRYAAARGKPLIISTGMANLEEIQAARTAALEAGAPGVVLLHCVSSYPAEMADANVRTVADMAQRFDSPIGLSDHTHGTVASVAAIAMGASVIEKHFTLARADGGPDAAFSLEPAEFAHLVRDCQGRLDRARAAPTTTCWVRSAPTASSAARSTSPPTWPGASRSAAPTSARSGQAMACRPPIWTRCWAARLHAILKRGEPLAWDMLA